MKSAPALAAASLLVPALFPGAAAATPTPASRAALPPGDTGGLGAAVPFVTYEAEDGITNGRLLGPSAAPAILAVEASGRRAVQLLGASEYLEIELTRAADGLTIRYSIPDSADGRGLDGTLLLTSGGRAIAAVPLTSRYSWYYGRYPFSNDPADGNPRHVYDDARIRLPFALPAGSRLRLSLSPGSPAGWVAIDLIDAEPVPPPATAPAGALSVVAFGADPTARRSSAPAFDRALAAGSHLQRPVWIPPGMYRIDRHLTLDRVTLAGAGEWYSQLRGRGIGLYAPASRPAVSVHLSGFAIVGDVTRRDDRKHLAAVGGRFTRSSIRDLWIQHTQAGLWLDGPADRVSISGLRILDQAADGVNFHGGIARSRISNTFVRGSGDDGLAMWSHPGQDSGDTFDHNTVIAPSLANGIALYGGRNLTVSHNLIADAGAEGGGIHLGSRFSAARFEGTQSIDSNLVARSGGLDPHWHFGIGAFWIYALDRPISATIRVTGLILIDSQCEAIQLLGKRIRGVYFAGVTIRGGARVLQLQASGWSSFANVVATGVASDTVASDGASFKAIDGGGLRGWDGDAIVPVNRGTGACLAPSG